MKDEEVLGRLVANHSVSLIIGIICHCTEFVADHIIYCNLASRTRAQAVERVYNIETGFCIAKKACVIILDLFLATRARLASIVRR